MVCPSICPWDGHGWMSLCTAKAESTLLLRHIPKFLPLFSLGNLCPSCQSCTFPLPTCPKLLPGQLWAPSPRAGVCEVPWSWCLHWLSPEISPQQPVLTLSNAQSHDKSWRHRKCDFLGVSLQSCTFFCVSYCNTKVLGSG